MDEKIKSDLLDGIETKTLYRTPDGRLHDSLELAMGWRRRRAIVDAIFNDRAEAAEWMQVRSEQIADHAEDLFRVLAPFFEPLTPAPEAAEPQGNAVPVPGKCDVVLAGDKLKANAINALQQPLIAIRAGGDRWPIHDICVGTGMTRIDVCGKLQIIDFGELLEIEDGNGDRHDADDFYVEGE